MADLPAVIRSELGVGRPGLDGVADRNRPFNVTDMVDADLPMRRFLAAGRDGDTWLVAVERGGRGYNVEVFFFSALEATPKQKWVLLDRPKTLREVTQRVSQLEAVPPARAVVRALGFAAPETIRLSPDLASEQEDPKPTVDYPSFDIARDSIGAIVRRTLNPAERTIRVNGGPVRFKYWYAADSADGWAFDIVVADTSECPDSRVENALQAAGWAPAYGYSADGTDGSVMGFVTKRFLCVVDGQWDGGDPSDSTYVPQPGCEVTVTCVPRRSDDVPKW